MGSSNIEWTEMTWNPVVGCAMVSPGCTHCYAETMSKRLAAMALKDISEGKNPGRKEHYLHVMNSRGKWNGNVATVPEALTDPLKRKAPTTWFVNSMSDLFHADVPFDFIDRIFAVMTLTPRHTYQILTKRPERMAEYLNDFYPEGGRLESMLGAMESSGKSPFDNANSDDVRRLAEIDVLPNVWLGTSVEDQQRADDRIPHLLKCPAAVRFLSVEPLLGPVEVSDVSRRRDAVAMLGKKSLPGISWVIVGGESGPGARPCAVEWIRDVVRQCAAADVPCFVKQVGAKPYTEEQPADWRKRFQQPAATWDNGIFVPVMKDKKGGDPAEWPADLRVREMPVPSKT